MASQYGNIHKRKMYFHTGSKNPNITEETIIQNLRHTSLNTQKQQSCQGQTKEHISKFHLPTSITVMCCFAS